MSSRSDELPAELEELLSAIELHASRFQLLQNIQRLSKTVTELVDALDENRQADPHLEQMEQNLQELNNALPADLSPQPAYTTDEANALLVYGIDKMLTHDFRKH